MKNLDVVMVEAYQSSAGSKDDDDNKDDAREKDSVKEDPRPNEYENGYEILNFLDAEDAELNTAEADNKEFLY